MKTNPHISLGERAEVGGLGCLRRTEDRVFLAPLRVMQCLAISVHAVGALMYHVKIYYQRRYTMDCVSAARYRVAIDTKAYRGSRARTTSPVRTGTTATPANALLALCPGSLKSGTHVDQMIPIPSAACRATPSTRTEYSTMLRRGQPLSAALTYS